jgi:hypothetical protein
MIVVEILAVMTFFSGDCYYESAIAVVASEKTKMVSCMLINSENRLHNYVLVSGK